MTMEDCLPCKKCGSTRLIRKANRIGQPYIRCGGCPSFSLPMPNFDMAVKEWNRYFGAERSKMEPINEQGLVLIPTKNIIPHKDNPRLQLGDLTELTESIRKNGVLQNLTVMPKEGSEGKYIVLIGHRRLAAAHAAGVKEVPCKIVKDIDRNEQIAIMLQENMQRNDLTIYEQSQSFQLMLDLGETVQTVAEKTGFSETTVRRRVKLSELDQKVLKKKNEDEGFQLNLNDLYELSKVEDKATRNKILNDAKSSRDMLWAARNAVKEQEREKALVELKKKFKAQKINKAPAGVTNYTNGYEDVLKIDLDNPLPEKLEWKDNGNQVVWCKGYGSMVYLIRKEKRVVHQKTEAEKAEDLRRKNRKELLDIFKVMAKNRQTYIQDIFTGKVKTPAEVNKNMEAVLRILTAAEIKSEGWFSESAWYGYVLGKEKWSLTAEEKNGDAFTAPVTVQHLVLAGLVCGERTDGHLEYPNVYKEEKLAGVKLLYDALEMWGYQMSEDEKKVLDGTHELYDRRRNDN